MTLAEVVFLRSEECKVDATSSDSSSLKSLFNTHSSASSCIVGVDSLIAHP